ncbi:MAG: FtsW/RodA/SpoVE family cell cycle protein, partial [Phycisphaerae bacterium]|nr:FtsW/RodA/SpoVE family cell cycle protein [Phycisphaerae bacterium]
MAGGSATSSAFQGAQSLSAEGRLGSGSVAGVSRSVVGTIILIVCGLMGIGILMVFSTGFDPASPHHSYHFARHIIFVPLAIGVMLLLMCINVNVLNNRWVAVGLLALVLFLLAAVLVLNSGPMGTRRWFRFRAGSMDLGFQPSEVAKIGIVIFLAWLLSRSDKDPKSFKKTFIPVACVIGVVACLLAVADFGTAALIGVVALVLCVMGGVRLRHLALLVPPGMLGVYLLVWHVPYRRTRLLSFMDPWADVQGT